MLLFIVKNKLFEFVVIINNVNYWYGEIEVKLFLIWLVYCLLID